MQHTQTQNPQENRSEPARKWHPFSWRRMNSRNVWILLAVAVAFILIGLVLT